MKSSMKGHWTVSVLASILILGGFGLSQQAFAEFTSISPTNDPIHCDTLFAPEDVDEIGEGSSFGPFGPFPIEEELVASFINPVGFPSCISFDSAIDFDPIIQIRNNVSPPTAFPEVWYVADIDTDVSNWDGFDGGTNEMFLIDSVNSTFGCGVNCPLISESFEPGNGIWEPGETWSFILQDFVNFGGASPFDLNSIGVGFASVASTPGLSSGSIVVEPFGGIGGGPVGGTSIPIDTTALLVAGSQTISPWLILGVISAVGIGVTVFTLKRSR